MVQAALKLVLEPIFEADFQPCSYGFRPGRRAQDAIAEIHHLTSRPAGYEWVVEGDITACFDTIDHTALLARVRRRIADKRVLALIKAFCKAGILTQDGAMKDTITGTPQGGHPLPAAGQHRPQRPGRALHRGLGGLGPPWTRKKRTRKGLATWRLVRYADDFVVLVKGTRAHAQALCEEAAAVLAPMGLGLSAAKTRITHIDEGFDFLGFRIQRRRRAGTNQRYVYTYPSKKALQAIVGKVRTLTHRTRTDHWRSCCTGSTRCCGAGAPTSAMGCPAIASATWRPTPGVGSSVGCGAGTPIATGRPCAEPSCPDGCRHRTGW